MGSTPVGEEFLDAIDGIKLGIVMNGRGVTEGECEDQYGVGDTVVWSDFGLSQV